MLSTIPTIEKSKPKSWTIPILIGVVILLSLALSELAALYYSNVITANPDIVIINQTSNNSTNSTFSMGKVSNPIQTHQNIISPDKKDKDTSNQENSNKQDKTATQNNNLT